MKKLILAKSAGFCFGVNRSVDMAEKLLREKGSCCSLGHLIHNEDVVRELAGRGLRVIQSPEEAETGDNVLIRAHGVSAQVYHRLEEKGALSSSSACAIIPRWRESAAGAESIRYLKMPLNFLNGWIVTPIFGINP